MRRIAPTAVPKTPALVRRRAAAAAVGLGLGAVACGGRLDFSAERSGANTSGGSTSVASLGTSSTDASGGSTTQGVLHPPPDWSDAGAIDASVASYDAAEASQELFDAADDADEGAPRYFPPLIPPPPLR